MPAERYTVKTNCKFCGVLFDSFNLNKVCPECGVKLEADFINIRDYLERYPNSTAMEISEALDIPLPVITFFIREDRLVLKKVLH